MAHLKASIDFGLVHIPVEIVPAEDRQEKVSFHLLDSKDKSRVRYKRVNENTGKEVEWEDIVKGYEVQKDKYVIFTEEDLDTIEAESNKSLAIDVFVDKSEFSNTFFETPYYLIPGKGGEKAYVLLERALEQSGKLAVIQAVLRNREQLGVIYAEGGGLVLDVIRYPKELKSIDDVLPASISKIKISEKETAMARQLLKQMSGKFRASKYKDSYDEKLHSMIKKKVKAGTSRKPKGKEEKAKKTEKTIDIMQLLSKSLKSKTTSSSKRKKAA